MVLVFFSLLSFLPGQKAYGSSSLSHLNSGRPGCWALFRSGALTNEAFRDLPEDCQEFREDYFEALKLVKKNPASFEAKLIEVLRGAKTPKAPYEAIFLASLLKTDALVQALRARAEVEKKLEVPFSYAKTALFRIENQDCQKNREFSHPFFKEICSAKDSILTTFFELGPK